MSRRIVVTTRSGVRKVLWSIPALKRYARRLKPGWVAKFAAFLVAFSN